MFYANCLLNFGGSQTRLGFGFVGNASGHSAHCHEFLCRRWMYPNLCVFVHNVNFHSYVEKLRTVKNENASVF